MYSNNKSILYRTMGGISVLALLFFFTSSFLFGDSSDVIHTKVGTKTDLKNREIELVSWTWNEKENVMNVVLLEKVKVDVPVQLEYQAVAKSKVGESLTVKEVATFEGKRSLVIEDLPKNFGGVSLKITEKMVANDSISTIKMYADERVVEKNNKTHVTNQKEQIQTMIEQELMMYEEKVKEIEKQLKEKDESILFIQEQINELENSKKYKTESEIIETDGQIQQKKSSIETTKRAMSELENELKEVHEKIKKLGEKLENHQKDV